jgi:MFS family permease
MPTPANASTLKKIPPGVWVLGFVSMLMDISSEMIHSLLPLFMVGTLGASALMVGLIEGLAESTALIVKVFSGVLSDYWGKRKGLALVGYALGALTKPLFAMAPVIGVVLTARLLDRVGKGIRGAPRDALVADIPVEIPAQPSACGHWIPSVRSLPRWRRFDAVGRASARCSGGRDSG